MPRPERKDIMLAYPTEEGRVLRLGNKYFAQPKLRGERCRIEWFHNEPVLISSYGNDFKYMEHIQDALTQIRIGQIPFDGELYVHGWNQERINSAANRKVNVNPDSPKLEYHIFDIQDTNSAQTGRTAVLEALNKAGLIRHPLHLVETRVVRHDSWLRKCQEYCDDGYEGIILRDPDAPYYIKRNVCMLKHKPTEIDEYAIISVKEAISEDGYPKSMVGSFQVAGDDGTPFYVGAGKMKHPERIRLWRNRGDIIGRTLIVKHEKIKTVGGKPLCAVAVEMEEE